MQDNVTAEPATRIVNTAGSDLDAIRKRIQDSENQDGSSVSLATTRRTRIPAERIEDINRGISTILNGVGGASVEQILRGPFMFPMSNNVRCVANNVLDSIFGRRS